MNVDGSDDSPSPIDPSTAYRPPAAAERAVALIEVLLCSDYPTQWMIAVTLAVLGLQPSADGTLTLSYVATLSLIDSVVLLALIAAFLSARRERLTDLITGQRAIVREVWRGLPLTIAAFAIALAVLGTIQLLAPRLHNVPENPLQALMKTPLDTAIFLVVVIVAGGVREEIQRAFLLRRFEQWLGGAAVGLVVTSALFGAGHYPQGIDAVFATAALGAFWGLVYLRRRSAVAPIVSHAGFNVLQLLQFVIISRR
jgi:membrane protease YdiL (CAAX protease family)